MLSSIELTTGRSMSFREEGRGQALVQVHGIGTGHHNFDLLTPHLAKRFRVLDVDLPGYGDSDPLAEPRTIDGLADTLGDFIDQIGIAPADVHGTSFGGLVATSLAATRPNLIARLVITCSFARLDNAMRAMQHSWRSAAEAGPALLAEVTSVQGFSRGFWDRPDAQSIQDAFITALASSSPDDFLRDLPLMEEIDLGETVARIPQPTLLLAASEDQMTPLQTAPSGLGMTDLARLIPNAQLEVLDGCGHFISIERAEETAAVISTFLSVPKVA